MNTRIAVICAAVLILHDGAEAQSIRNAGSAGAQFLKIGVGARAMGMGGAFGTVAAGAEALAWNPAGIGAVDKLEVSAQHTAWVAEINHSFIGAVLPVSDQVNLGFHTIFLTSGDIEITTIDQPEGTGRFFDVADIAVGLTASVRLTSQLTVAGTVKYVEERIYDVKGGTVALDAGTWYDTGLKSLRLGFAVSQIGFDHDYSGRSLEVRYLPPGGIQDPTRSELQTARNALPLTFRASGCADLLTLVDEPDPAHRALIALDFIQHSDTPERFAAGMEYTWEQTLSLRGGYLFNADELGWNAGAGVHLDASEVRLSADYAVSGLGRFGIGHRFGLTIGAR